MITNSDLIELGWTQDKYDKEDYTKGHITASLQEGKIIFVREWDNYHGISVSIKTVSEFQLFISYLSKRPI